jgi:hypothetical protein
VQVCHTKTEIVQGKIAITTKKFVSKFCNLAFFVVLLVVDDNLNVIGFLHHYSLRETCTRRNPSIFEKKKEEKRVVRTLVGSLIISYKIKM